MAVLTQFKQNKTIIALASEHMARSIEYASRTCYNSHDKTTKDSYINHIKGRIKSGHTSVAEHGMFSVILDYNATDRDVVDELDALKDALTESNSLLHYKHNYIEKGDGRVLPIIILSGNIIMWRALICHILDDNSAILRQLIDIFQCYSFLNHNIYTSDIPKLAVATTNLKRKFSDTHVFGSLPFIDDENGKTIRPMMKRVVPLIDGEDYGEDEPKLSLRIINMDNFITELTMAAMRIQSNNPNERGEYGKYVSSQLIPYLITSIKDISSVTYEVTMPRIITQQEARHRINSISQQSQRYVCENGKGIENFYVPAIMNEMSELYDKYMNHMKESIELYEILTSNGVKNEDARFVLPNAIYSTMVVTKPLYTLDHYFKERCGKAAQTEIRLPAIGLKNYINNTFKAFVEKDLF